MSRCFRIFTFLIWFLGFELVDLVTLDFELPELCHHFTFSEKSTQKKARCCTLSLASSSPWDQDIVSCSIGLHTQYLGITPQQGPPAPSTHQCRDVGPKSRQLLGGCVATARNSGAKNAWFCDLCGSAWEDCIIYPKSKAPQSKIVLKEVILDRTRSSTLGRPTWRRKPEAAAQEKQKQRQRQGQGTQRSPADTTCTTSSTAAFWPGRATAAAMDEHASTSWSIDIFNDNIVASRAEIEGGFQPTQKGESRNAHTGATAVCGRGNQSCQQEGCQDPLLSCGSLDKGKRGARHGDPGQEQPDGAMESFPHHVPGAVSSIYRPLPKPRTGASGKHQAGQGKTAQGQGGFQLQRGSSNCDLRRRGGVQSHNHQRISCPDFERAEPYDREPPKAVRPSSRRASRGRTQSETPSAEGRRPTRCRHACRKLAIYAAFWCARSLMTLEYFDRWAAWPPTAIAAEVAGMQWSHSILQEPCYKSPWQASEDALHLAFTLQPDSLVRYCEKREWGFSVPHKRCKKGLKVSFNPLAHVHFGPEFNSSWTTRRVPTAGVSKRDWLPKSSTFSQSLCNGSDENFSSQPILALSSPQPIECRPDLTENPNLPDPPSSSEGSEGRGRPRRVPIRHLPAWVATLWNILQDEGATELLEEGPVIYLSTFYLSHRNCIRQAVSRPIRLTRRYEEWIDEFKQVWGDLFDHDSDFSLFLVQPEPPISITRGIVGIVLIVQHEQPDNGTF